MITGLFDNMINLGQAYMADITTLRNRSRYLARLESFQNISQCIGPLLAAVLSKIDLYYPLYVLFILTSRNLCNSWLAVALYSISFFYVTAFLPESVSSVVEKNEILATFELVKRHGIFFLVFHYR